jgi:hypothetical protein
VLDSGNYQVNFQSKTFFSYRYFRIQILCTTHRHV